MPRDFGGSESTPFALKDAVVIAGGAALVISALDLFGEKGPTPKPKLKPKVRTKLHPNYHSRRSCCRQRRPLPRPARCLLLAGTRTGARNY